MLFKPKLCVILFFVSIFETLHCFEIQPRIVNGSPSARGQFPFHVHIDIMERVNSTKFSICGGALLNHRFVLTAGHCLHNTIQAALYLGSLRINTAESERQYIFVEQKHFHIHPQFELKHLRNDIGLIKLSDRAVYSHVVQPILLPTTCNFPDGMSLTIAGNGLMKTDRSPAEILQYTRLTTIPYSKCDELYGIRDTNAIFCANGYKNNSICQGDSGGPLFDPIKRTIYGIASFTANTCNEFPQGFTNVIHYFPWISQITRINLTNCN